MRIIQLPRDLCWYRLLRVGLRLRLLRAYVRLLLLYVLMYTVTLLRLFLSHYLLVYWRSLPLHNVNVSMPAP